MLRSRGIAASDEAVEAFMRWQLADEWKRYNDYLMNQTIILQNLLDRLPLGIVNGRQGEPYARSVSLDIDNLGEVWIERFEIPGLTATYDPATRCLSIEGTPTAAGDFEFSICCRPADLPDHAEGRAERSVSLAFNPDPRSLWRDIPTPADIPFYKPECDSRQLSFHGITAGDDALSILAASRRGRSHAHEGSARDDDFAIGEAGQSGWLYAIVADGAGSAAYSRKGSALACEVMATEITNRINELSDSFEDAIRRVKGDGRTDEDVAAMTRIAHSILYDSAFRANREIKALAEATEGARVKDFNTTLLACLLKKMDFGWFVASFWIGDGAIAIYDEAKGEVKLMGEPDGGEFAGQTRFLTMDSVFSDRGRMRFSFVDDFTAVMLMTDGVSDPRFETDANLRDPLRWNSLWDDLRREVFSAPPATREEAMLDWLNFWSKGNHDDRTIVVIH